MTSDFSFPIPVPTLDNQQFWDACRQHRLVIQRCLECQSYRHPPRPACHRCNSVEWEWTKSKGRGIVYTYTVTHQAVHPALTDRVPWLVVLVELEEGVRMISNLADCPIDRVEIGMEVEVVFVDVTEELTLPRFRPVQPLASLPK